MNLAETVARLEAAVAATEARLAAEFPDPLTVVDSRGRYILLDAYTELVKAKRALEGK